MLKYLKFIEPNKWNINPIDYEVDLEREVKLSLKDMDVAKVKCIEYNIEFNKKEKEIINLKS